METTIANGALHPSAGAADNLKIAISAILAGVFALSLGDALIRSYSADFVVWQIFLMRSLIAAPLLVYLVRLEGCGIPIRPFNFRWTLLRSLILVVMWLFYFAALPHIELAVAAAAYYTSPLFIVLFAALFLGERVGARGWLAVALGFVGTLMVLQPRASDFNPWSLLPIVAAVCYAAAMTLTRGRCRAERPLVLALWLNFGFIAAGGLGLLWLWLLPASPQLTASNPFLFGAWTPMWLEEWRAMAILAIAILVGSAGAAIAYQRGPASIVASFDFAYVAFAVIWGLLLFGETPSASITTGIALIVGGGLLASYAGSKTKAT